MADKLKFTSLDLFPLPTEREQDWVAEFQRLSLDPYVSRKYNRMLRMAEKRKYFDERLRDLVSRDHSGLVVDIGPGPGEFLEICRSYGYGVLGIDAADGFGGMGDEYLQISRLLCERQLIPVNYCGLQPVIDHPDAYLHPNSVRLWNSQGSIEQAFSDYLAGEPHSVHKDCRKLSWRIDDALRERFAKLFQMFSWSLCEGGTVLIYANGATNTDAYELLVEDSAKQAGLVLMAYEQRLHRWMKPGPDWHEPAGGNGGMPEFIPPVRF